MPVLSFPPVTAPTWVTMGPPVPFRPTCALHGVQHPAAHHVRRAEARRRGRRRGAFEGEAAVGGVEEEPVVT